MSASPPTSLDPLLPGPGTGGLQAPGTRGLPKRPLQPFKGKGVSEAWASQCFAMRDELIGLAQRQVLQQASGPPFHLLRRGTGPADHWRGNDRSCAGAGLDRSAMGVALWQELMASTSTPANLLADLYAIELQRITLNMQISLLHTLG
ncbi:MAG: DUF3158 family protein [Pseudoxanthomonas sp.]|nr:DUF3158 family protein [Pseudoxanthomonas sp.]